MAIRTLYRFDILAKDYQIISGRTTIPVIEAYLTKDGFKNFSWLVAPKEYKAFKKQGLEIRVSVLAECPCPGTGPMHSTGESAELKVNKKLSKNEDFPSFKIRYIGLYEQLEQYAADKDTISIRAFNP